MLMMTVTVKFPFSNQQTFQEFLRLILFVNRAQSENEDVDQQQSLLFERI